MVLLIWIISYNYISIILSSLISFKAFFNSTGRSDNDVNVNNYVEAIVIKLVEKKNNGERDVKIKEYKKKSLANYADLKKLSNLLVDILV